MGTACLTCVDHVGRGFGDARLELAQGRRDDVDLFGSQLDASTAAGHAVQPFRDEPRVLVARGIERPADHLQPLDPHVACVGRREHGELGRACGHRDEHGAGGALDRGIRDQSTVEQHLDARV